MRAMAVTQTSSAKSRELWQRSGGRGTTLAQEGLMARMTNKNKRVFVVSRPPEDTVPCASRHAAPRARRGLWVAALLVAAQTTALSQAHARESTAALAGGLLAPCEALAEVPSERRIDELLMLFAVRDVRTQFADPVALALRYDLADAGAGADALEFETAMEPDFADVDPHDFEGDWLGGELDAAAWPTDEGPLCR